MRHIKTHNTEDKKYWVEKYGLKHELRFIEIIKSLGDYDLKINPEKTEDPTSIDYIWNGQLADLKTQTTPFFTSARYGIDARYAVTFNRNDYERYLEYEKRLQKPVQIFFWIDWQQLTWNDKSINYLFGIYYGSLRRIKKMVLDGAPEHAYLRRKNDIKGNAKSSFILDIRNFNMIYQKRKQQEVEKEKRVSISL